MKSDTVHIGVDVSKDKLDIYVPAKGEGLRPVTHEVGNRVEGFRELREMARKAGATISAALCGCASFPGGPSAVNVGSYNIRFVRGDTGTPNDWDERKDDLVDEIRALGMDVFGLQEVCLEQAEYITNALPQYALVGEFREADRKSGEASPVCFRKDRFAVDKSGTFWLSETPEEPGVKGWGAACPRVCSWALLSVGGQPFILQTTSPWLQRSKLDAEIARRHGYAHAGKSWGDIPLAV